MTVVVDFEFVISREGHWLIKELAIVSQDCKCIGWFLFRCPADEDSRVLTTVFKHDIHWLDGFIDYDQLETILEESLASSSCLFAYNEEKAAFLAAITGKTFIDMRKECSMPDITDLHYTNQQSCTFQCHRLPDRSCALRNAIKLANWLTFYQLTIQNTRCPYPDERHEKKNASVKSSWDV